MYVTQLEGGSATFHLTLYEVIRMYFGSIYPMPSRSLYHCVSRISNLHNLVPCSTNGSMNTHTHTFPLSRLQIL